ncbi:MAG: phosphodiester glycosidase family protein [Cytophagales bacterium]|nr:phosphodiester glycosidase family protein [Cytophagales bacterium]
MKFYWKDDKGKRFGSIQNLKGHLNSNNKELVFATNGGMYASDGSPQGLYIEKRKLIKKLDAKTDGYGNFYLQPNGVFFLSKNREAYIKPTNQIKIKNILYATQSGPMLLIDGMYNKHLKKGSKNLHIRNGVGILPNGNVIFVISIEKTNFYDLATLFYQKGCKNALYLDGFVSRTYLPGKNWEQLDGSFGVIIAESK